MLLGRAAKRPERILQALGERHETLAAKDNVGMLEAGKKQAEMIKPVLKRLSRDGDAKDLRKNN